MAVSTLVMMTHRDIPIGLLLLILVVCRVSDVDMQIVMRPVVVINDGHSRPARCMPDLVPRFRPAMPDDRRGKRDGQAQADGADEVSQRMPLSDLMTGKARWNKCLASLSVWVAAARDRAYAKSRNGRFAPIPLKKSAA